MYKRILLPLDPAISSEKALAMAVYLAKSHNAILEGLVILDMPGIEQHVGPLPLGSNKQNYELQYNIIQDAQNVISKIIQKFESKCIEHKINYTITTEKGTPYALIIDKSRFYDLIVVGRETHFNFAVSDQQGVTFDKIMSKTVAPLLAVPEYIDIEKATNGTPTVLIALDGSIISSKAVQRFCQLISDKNSIVELVISHSNQDFAYYLLDNTESLIRAFGIEKINKSYTDDNLINYIDKYFLGMIDLYVIGQHNKSAITDFFLGNFTKYLVKNTHNLLFIGN